MQLTRVGVWYLVAVVVVVLAATNTGNNGLFLTVAAMVAAIFVTHLAAAWNVKGLEVEVEAGGELFANSPCRLRLRAHNRRRLVPAWLIAVSVEPGDLEPEQGKERRGAPWLIDHLAPRAAAEGQVEVLLSRRGPRRLRFVSVASLFPLGLFRKGRRYPQDVEILVYPELYAAAASALTPSGRLGERSLRRPGRGAELHTLREYRPGDDPRGIHWKQTARQRQLIYQQRQSEKQRRLRIIFDNAVGELDEDGAKRFERLVSEAATAAVEALDNGYEVALLTRDGRHDFAAGARQRRNLLEALARLEVLPLDPAPLAVGEEAGMQLRLGDGAFSAPATVATATVASLI